MRIRKKRTVHHCTCADCRAHPRGETANEHRAINQVVASLDERNRRRFAGLLAWQWGRGGVERVSEITGLSRPTIRRGRTELQHADPADRPGRIRQPGAGRLATEKNIRSL